MRPRAAWVALQTSAKMLYVCQLVKLKALMGISLDQQEQQVALLHRLVRDAQRGQMPQDPLLSIAQSQNKAIDQLLGKGAGKQQPPQTPQPTREPQPAPSPTTSLPSIISPRVWERINSTFNPFASASASSSSSISTSDAAIPSNTESKFSGWPFWPLLPIQFPPSLLIAASTFQAALAKNWFNSRLDLQPKGSFLVFGEVEVAGERAKAKCDVKAAYDPKEGKYLWVVCNVKHLWEINQRAKGGP